MVAGIDFQRLLTGNTVTGVELHIGKDGSETYRFTKLSKTKNEISVSDKGGAYHSLAELAPFLNAKIPICLSITGKDVIFKKIEISDITHETELLETIFPNVNAEEFYLQSVTTSVAYFVSVIRNIRLSEIIEEFQNKGISVIHIEIGPVHIAETLTITESINSRSNLNIGNASFDFINNELTNCVLNPTEFVDENIDVGGEIVRKSELTAFSVGFRYLLGLSPNQPTVSQLEATEFSYSSLFKISGLLAASILFCILVGSLSLGYINSKKLDGLEFRLSENKEQIMKVAQLKQQLNQKRESLFYLGMIEHPKSSFYADRIGGTVPSKITLQSLKFFPLQRNKDQFEKTLRFDENVILIEGQTPKSVVLNDWIKELNQFEWLADITIISYEQKPEKGVGEFGLRLILNTESDVE
ncbi:MAG: hypothetical protein JKY53_11835 [Flavobacteriales bacterium]|nr:hypothetical protein [Flavobacteriales bacterium]